MEAAMLTVLSVFAFIGVINTIYYIFRQIRPKNKDSGYRLIVYIPQNSDVNPDYIIRQIFLEEVPERLISQGVVYCLTNPEDSQTRESLERMKTLYPIEVLPDQAAYCMITEREKSKPVRN